MRTSTFSVLVALSLAACGEKASPPRPEPAAATTRTAIAVTETARPPATPIARARVDALLTAWVDAQNQGRFDAYSALYAARFDGIRRSRDRVVRLDRAGWMADRQRMFARPMTVAISDVEVSSSPNVVNVRFTQRWSSGTYSDEGPKRMLLTPEGEGLRISIEEMLDSRGLSGVEATIAGGVFSAYETNAGTLVVLGEVSDALGAGAPRLTRAEASYIALRDAAAGVPAVATALVGTEVHLVGTTGRCTANITKLSVASIAVPHFGTVQAWSGEGDGEEVAVSPALSQAEIAREIVGMSERHWLVGNVQSTCGLVRVATKGANAPVVYASAVPTPAVTAEVTRLLAGAMGSALRDAMREGLSMEAEEGAPAIDDAAVSAGIARALAITVFTHEASEVVTVKVPAEGPCGGSIHTFLFERVGGALVRRAIGDDVVDFEAIIDATGDGTPEAAILGRFGDSRSIMRLGETPATLTSWAGSNFDCDC